MEEEPHTDEEFKSYFTDEEGEYLSDYNHESLPERDYTTCESREVAIEEDEPQDIDWSSPTPTTLSMDYREAYWAKAYTFLTDDFNMTSLSDMISERKTVALDGVRFLLQEYINRYTNANTDERDAYTQLSDWVFNINRRLIYNLQRAQLGLAQIPLYDFFILPFPLRTWP